MEKLREIHEIVREARARVAPLRMDAGEARARLEAGHPLLSETSAPVDVEVADRILNEICRIAGTPEAIRLRESAQEQPIGFQAVADALVGGGDRSLPEVSDVSQEFLAFVVLAALRPSFRRHAEHLQPLTEEMPWRQTICPVCGSVPSLAELRGEPGCRYLRCALCEASWRVRRLRCPFCGTTDHSQLRILRVEGEPGMRLDLCDACGRYLKTRIAPDGQAETDPFGWDLATLHLDALARGQGYSAAAPGPD